MMLVKFDQSTYYIFLPITFLNFLGVCGEVQNMARLKPTYMIQYKYAEKVTLYFNAIPTAYDEAFLQTEKFTYLSLAVKTSGSKQVENDDGSTQITVNGNTLGCRKRKQFGGGVMLPQYELPIDTAHGELPKSNKKRKLVRPDSDDSAPKRR